MTREYYRRVLLTIPTSGRASQSGLGPPPMALSISLFGGPLHHVFTADTAATNTPTNPKARLRQERAKRSTDHLVVHFVHRGDAGATEHLGSPAPDVVLHGCDEGTERQPGARNVVLQPSLAAVSRPSAESRAPASLHLPVIDRVQHRIQEGWGCVGTGPPEVIAECAGCETCSKEAPKSNQDGDGDSSNPLHRVAPM
jgi:hypothetical protein